MIEDIQHALNLSLDLCRFENGDISPCAYHQNRCHSSIYKITENTLTNIGQNQAILKRTKDILKLANLFAIGEDPAGGWYLVKEQREWLEDQLKSWFEKNPFSNIRILESGAASYIHHYTYLSIIIKAAKLCSFPLKNIYLDVVDKCIFPIYQIGAIENEIRYENRSPKFVKIYSNKMKIPKEHIDFIKSIKQEIQLINTRLFLRDLRDLEEIHQIGTYNVITEHFLTSVLRQDLKEIEKTRISYKKILQKNGVLLCATGLINDMHYNSFIDIHINNGFKFCNDSIRKVWDPYGLNRDEIEKILFNKSYSPVISLDNYLLKFYKSE